ALAAAQGVPAEIADEAAPVVGFLDQFEATLQQLGSSLQGLVNEGLLPFGTNVTAIADSRQRLRDALATSTPCDQLSSDHTTTSLFAREVSARSRGLTLMLVLAIWVARDAGSTDKPAYLEKALAALARCLDMPAVIRLFQQKRAGKAVMASILLLPRRIAADLAPYYR